MHVFTEYLLERKKQKGYLFVPYIAIGDPDYETSYQVINKLIEFGADTVELGLPFTDPSADGPVLQRAFKRILQKPFQMADFLANLDRLHKKNNKIKFIVMGYANLFLQAGFAHILKEFQKRNVAAVIIPDIPFDEKQHLIEELALQPLLENISWIDFITPTITEKKMVKIAEQASGFLYIISYRGVTGQTNFSLKPMKPVIKQLRHITKIPLLAGFGISEKSHMQEAISVCDGFITGSMFHLMIERNLDRKLAIAPEIGWALPNLLPT